MAGTFQGQFLWVNHDADNLKAQPHQYRVFSHVQSQYRKWRRRKENEQLTASVKIPRIDSRNQNKRRKVDVPSPLVVKHEKLLSLESPPMVDIVPLERSRQALPPPIKWQGNSDPFASFVVPVGPRVNQLITFERDALHPALHGGWGLRSTEWDYCSACWSWLLPHLKTSATGSKGFLATIASILSKCVHNESEFLHLSLVYKHQAMKLLQTGVAQSTTQVESTSSTPSKWYHRQGEPDLLAIFTLLLCEMFNDNYAAATAHLKMLRSLMSSPAPSDTDNPWGTPSMLHNLYSRILFQDVQRAASTLTPTILSMSTPWWTSIGMAAAVIPNTIPPHDLPPDSRNIPINTPLYTLFSDIRSLSLQLAYALCPAPNPSPSTPPFTKSSLPLALPRQPSPTPSDYFYIWNYGIILSGRCINHALTSLSHRAWRDVYASLAMVYFIRHMSSREGVVFVPGSGVKFYSAKEGLLGLIREALEMEVEDNNTNENVGVEGLRFERRGECECSVERGIGQGLELRLWALYVGSLTGEEKWFMQELKKLAGRMGVESWQEAEGIFKGFSVHGHKREAWERALGMEC